MAIWDFLMTLVSMDEEPSVGGLIPDSSNPAQRCTMMQAKLLLDLRENVLSSHELLVLSKWHRENSFDWRGKSC